ncbi:UDP-N-acetylmuramoyl-L-alanine--D-glutamate ligase [Cytophaga hutchinsonii]|uniref:UDP-N-acetylmuramoylalanine--D-glutamate ligase n=1 Tax=Cytophaga hutchinsonii (strain ATCC 33406 / DSM 1761 / CIP 103989 / NBRC 15051 / NCIMB 9469 / D465) TaxID=269798 RepID=MURD_CYTH3|nr:UDP-N-acetylmuramoyl-L-alanine--D-glutamate ligase [Cytophaga hutchinsonii]Q11RH3.1 RecName: Full=UDP-N-acetylmuramoylalanine--D-glutamate ligase; AltName: Full=D-glutamic acid-adding enzyme; AltName: Full=UDP-N-acetylmuramoyl-L-alanyl-D-glutamate synthetase [Cytophaga hutchinsonii ATCC 33406]ABG59991.1 UDP-N-acetylmuramoylalanine--D-glutamate ligase [Cytophaga hutchinsonii ATCC 33406]SFX26106.1 UDP-N-acetylmuramoylalanine--D-glutamate ligase [Cytophaga hutchinsonii ATCC 33406]
MSQKIVILGSGESGVGAALLSKAKGYDTFVSDSSMITEAFIAELQQAGIAFEQGVHSEEKILSAQLIVKSPGIPEKAPIMKLIRSKAIEVISEIEFAYRHIHPGAKFIAITGSNGKTTTTLLTHHILAQLGYSVGLGGNIGTSLARQIIHEKKDVYVLELSSFQLDDMYTFKADVAVLLNITPDHLDRYEYKFENYTASKFRIFQNLTPADYYITYSEDSVIESYKKDHPVDARYVPVSLKQLYSAGAYSDEKTIQIHALDDTVVTCNTEEFPLQGKHNYINIMAALNAAVSIGADIHKSIASIKSFRNAPHRLEFVGSIYGVKFVNDSKATNVDSVWYALDSMKTPVVLIVGGVDKGNDYSQIEALVKEKVHTVVALGKDNSKVLSGFASMVSEIKEAHSMVEAIRIAHDSAKKGDTVLLSPACASFDLFKNYEDRGTQFRNLVIELAG